MCGSPMAGAVHNKQCEEPRAFKDQQGEEALATPPHRQVLATSQRRPTRASLQPPVWSPGGRAHCLFLHWLWQPCAVSKGRAGPPSNSTACGRGWAPGGLAVAGAQRSPATRPSHRCPSPRPTPPCSARGGAGSGPTAAQAAALAAVEQADLIRYGLIPEFVGRFPVISTLQVWCSCLLSLSPPVAVAAALADGCMQR